MYFDSSQDDLEDKKSELSALKSEKVDGKDSIGIKGNHLNEKVFFRNKMYIDSSYRFLRVRVGSIFMLLGYGSGQPSLVWVWVWKISSKNYKFFNFSPSG